MESTSYVFEQFKYDYVYRFMLNQMSTVEILENGNIVKEIFPIPTYCNFISEEDKENITYELTKNYTTDTNSKLEKFLLNMPKYKAKMKQNQKIARLSPMLYKMTQLTSLVKKWIFFINLFANMLIFYAYTYKYEEPTIVIIYDPVDWLKESVEF